MNEQHNYLDHASLLLDTAIMLRELEIVIAKAQQLHQSYTDALSSAGMLDSNHMRALGMINIESIYERI